MSNLPKAPPRLEAAEKWHCVSQGNIDAETLEWLKGAAAAIHAAAFLKTANARRLALEQATGLFGKANVNEYITRIAINSIPDATALQQRDGLAALLNLSPSNREEKEALRKRVARAKKKL